MATPNALLATQVGDLITTTLRELGRGSYTEIATNLQKHVAMKNLMRKNRIELASGYGIQWEVMVAETNAAQNVGIGAADNLNDVDVMAQATADWRNSVTSYPIKMQIMDMNRDPARIVDYVKIKRTAALLSMAELMESNFWGPPVAITDTLTPWGVNTWIVKNATQGFNGGVPSGYTTIGLNPTTYPNWKNWTDQYTNVSQDDFIRRARKAARFTDFEPPVDGIPTYNTGDVYGFYTNYGVLGPLEESLMGQNDNLGPDIASMDNKVMFLHVPVTWVPRLESDTTNPFYGINWGWFKTFILKGWWMKETHIPIYPGYHTTSGNFMDCTYQPVLRNRRANFVLATGTTYPS